MLQRNISTFFLLGISTHSWHILELEFILPLRVETGHFNTLIDPATRNCRHLRLHERICQLCNMGSTEDEYHFLMVCPLYKDYRDNLFNSITCPVINFNEMSNNDKFQYINKNH